MPGKLFKLNKEARAVVTEIGANKVALQLERDAIQSLALNVEYPQTGASRIPVLEAQLAERATRAAKAEQESVLVAELFAELRQERPSSRFNSTALKLRTCWRNAWQSWTTRYSVPRDQGRPSPTLLKGLIAAVGEKIVTT